MQQNVCDRVNTLDKNNFGMQIALYGSAPCKGAVKAFVEEDGVLNKVWDDPNVIVNGARRALSYLVATAEDNFKITTMRFGTGGHVQGDILIPISPSASDPALENEAYSKVITTWFFEPEAVETSVRFQVTLEKSEANGAGVVPYTEAGLYCANGTLFARETFPAIVKNSNRRVIFDWTLMF